MRKDSQKILARVSEIYIACMLTVFLVFPGRQGYVSISEDKAICFYLLSGAYALLITIFCLVFFWANIREQKQHVLRLSAPQVLILIYWGMTIVSAMLSEYPGTVFMGESRKEGLLTITLYCICFLWVSLFARPKEWMLWLFAGSVCVNDLLAILQLAGLNPLHMYPEGMNYYDAFKLYAGQFLGTIGNVDMVSAVLSLAIPVFWIAIVKLESRRRFLLLIPLGLTLGVLLTAFIAGGVLGVFAGAVLTIPVICKRGRRRKILTWSVVTLLVLGLVFVYFAGDLVGGFVGEAQQGMHGNWDDSFGSGRIYIWKRALELVDGHLLFGGGPDTMILRTDAVFERYNEELGVLIRSYVDSAHNEYLNILVNQGLLAVLAYLGALIWTAILWIRKAPENVAAAICGGAVLSYCIQAFFGISSLVSTPFFWLMLALLTACMTQENTMHAGHKRLTNKK